MPPNIKETPKTFPQALYYKQMCSVDTLSGNYGKYKTVCFNFSLLLCWL